MMNWTARHKKLPQLGPTLASTLWIELYCVLYLGGDTSDVRDSGSSGLNSPAFNQTLNTLDLFLWRYFISFINVYTILLKTLLTVHYELQQLEANIQTGHIGHHLVIRVWTVDSCVTSITKLYFIVVFYTMSSLSSAIYNFNFSLALAYMHAHTHYYSDCESQPLKCSTIRRRDASSPLSLACDDGQCDCDSDRCQCNFYTYIYVVAQIYFFIKRINTLLCSQNSIVRIKLQKKKQK